MQGSVPAIRGHHALGHCKGKTIGLCQRLNPGQPWAYSNFTCFTVLQPGGTGQQLPTPPYIQLTLQLHVCTACVTCARALGREAMCLKDAGWVLRDFRQPGVPGDRLVIPFPVSECLVSPSTLTPLHSLLPLFPDTHHSTLCSYKSFLWMSTQRCSSHNSVCKL